MLNSYLNRYESVEPETNHEKKAQIEKGLIMASEIDSVGVKASELRRILDKM